MVVDLGVDRLHCGLNGHLCGYGYGECSKEAKLCEDGVVNELSVLNSVVIMNKGDRRLHYKHWSFEGPQCQIHNYG